MTARTERAATAKGKLYSGIYWKTWSLKDGTERRGLYVSYYANGKLRWEKIPSNKIKEALKRRRALQTRVDKGDFVEPAKGRTTLADLCEMWLRNQTCKPQSVTKYRAVIDGHIVARLGGRQLRSLRPEDVEQLAVDLRERLDPNYLRLVVSLLRRILRTGVRLGYLHTNPADLAEPQFRKVKKKGVVPLTREEVRQLLNYTEEHKPEWHPFFVIAIHTGLRVGELLAMKWEYVDWERRTYTVAENLTRAREFEEPKTAESGAFVPLSAAAVGALAKQRAVLEVRRQWHEPDLRTDLVFANSRGKPYDYATVVYKVFKPLLKAAGVRDINFHGLRHTCASLLIASGASMKDVQAHLRHSRIEITMNTYAHLYPDHQAATADRLDALLAG